MNSNIKSDVKIYSVDEVTTHIKNLIEENKILQNIWVSGEISNFIHHARRHMYLTLKDENSIIKCAMFYGSNIKLKFKPKEGMKVLVRGRIEIYKKKGDYQIIIEEMQLAGEGELYLKFLQLKEKLEKEGLFKEVHKKSILKFPKSIGVITSLEGAAIRDIIKTIKRRYPHVKITIYPSLVQGDRAKETLVRGIRTLNQLYVEVIIIARGGGSFEDLGPFNEEIVAREIFKSKVPIITGVGHETDFTIADFVADKRAHTPSAAAELVVPDKMEVLNNLSNLRDRLCEEVIGVLTYYRQQINLAMSRPIFKRPFSLIEEHKQTLDERTIQIKQVSINKIKILKSELNGLDGKLNALSPYSILDRGYSITTKQEKIISSIKDINSGDVIFTVVKDGKIDSEVKKKNEGKII